MIRILTIIGTRPEAIKMAPILSELKQRSSFDSKLCVTAQHREMLDQVLELFDIKPEFDLNLMSKNQSLAEITSNILNGLPRVFRRWMPDIILVHGDTTTTFSASLSAFYHQILVVHVEAGLRTGDLYSPWPEEGNRKLTSTLAALHFAPTSMSASNLLKEGISESAIHVVGNSVIDALLQTSGRIGKDIKFSETMQNRFDFLGKGSRLLLVTAHRRENFGERFENICKALKELVSRNSDLDIVYPVHLNPNVSNPISKALSDCRGVHLIPPLEYSQFVYLMMQSDIILTDSGGVQEEAPSLGKPVLVMRDTTERPEALEAGTVKLVGANTQNIVSTIEQLLRDNQLYQKMAVAQNPYGDGQTSVSICNILEDLYR